MCKCVKTNSFNYAVSFNIAETAHTINNYM